MSAQQHDNHSRARAAGATRASSALWPRVLFSAAVLLGVLGAFNWIETIHWILRDYTALPVEDYWRVPQDVVRWHQIGPLRVFWTQHNEHRIPFPEAVELIDYWLWHGRRLLPLIVSFLCYLVSCFALSSAVLNDRRSRREWNWIAVMLAAAIVGWKGAVAVLAEPFLLQWTMMEAASALALCWLCDYRYKGAARYLLGVLIAGVVATYSSGNALLLWAVLLTAGSLLRLRRRDLIGIVVVAILADGLYFVGYVRSGHLNFDLFFRHPWYSAQFLCSYLSMPFGGMKGPHFAAALGALAIAAFLAMLSYSARQKLLATRPVIVLLGTYCFTILTAVLTAAGRMDPSDNFFTTAKAARYTTVPLLAWAALVTMAIWLLAGTRWRDVATPIVVVVIAAVAFIGALRLRWWFDAVQQEFGSSEWAALAAENGLEDPQITRRIFPQPAFVFDLLPYLRAHRLSVFSRGRSGWLGRPATSIAPKLEARAAGQVAGVYPVFGGLQLTGWADESTQTHGSEYLVFVNTREEVAGFGKRLGAGFPKDLRSPGIAASVGWVGFVNAKYKSDEIHAYLVNRSGLLPIGNAITYPNIEADGPENVGSPFPGVTWNLTSDFVPNGLPPGVNFGATPAGHVFSSWAGSDRHIGTAATQPVAAPPSDCIAIPLLHGPLVNGLAASVEDADTAAHLADLPMRDGDLAWSYWRVRLPSRTRNFRVVAQDNGKGWGNWIGIADPAQCR